MHIVLVNRCYPPYTGYGGISFYNYNLAHALVKLGHRVTVVASRHNKTTSSCEEIDGILVHRLLVRHYPWQHQLPLIGKHMRAVSNFFYSIRVSFLLSKIERNKPFDAVEFAEIDADGFFYMLKKRRCLTIIRCHTPTFVLKEYYTKLEMTYDPGLISKMEAYCIRKADLVTAPSHDMARVISEKIHFPLDKIVVIRNGFDVDEFSPREIVAAINSGNSKGQKIIVLCIGRLERVKGAWFLAKAMSSILEKKSNVELVFIGDDSLDPEGRSCKGMLRDLLDRFVKKDKVIFLNGLSQSQLIEWYRKADIAVVPSILYESFSYTCAQAMACGLPVIASKIGGIQETLDPKAGILFPPGDVDALTSALNKLIQDEKLRLSMGQAGREFAEKNFSVPTKAADLIRLAETKITGKK